MRLIHMTGMLAVVLVSLAVAGCGDEAGGSKVLEEPTLLTPDSDGPAVRDQSTDEGRSPGTPASPPSEQAPPGSMGTPNSPETPRDEEVDAAEETGLSCREIIDCFNGCSEGDRACLDECFAEGTGSGQSALQDLSDCYQTHSCRDQSCADEHCLWEQRVCTADGGGTTAPANNSEEANAPREDSVPNPEGRLTCTEIFGCFAECNRGDQACLDECRDQAFPSGLRAVDGIGACIRANQCQDNECVTENCSGQIRICDNDDGRLDLHQPDGRDLTCSEIETCFDACADDDGPCFDRCYNSGSAQAREALSSVGACIRRHDCQDQECVETHCADAIQACAADAPLANEPPMEQPAPASPDDGPLSCGAIIDCFQTCQDNQECMDTCFQRGAPDGQQALRELSACLQTHGCQNDDCMRSHCADQFQACHGDRPVPESPEGDQLTCVEVYQCSGDCPAGDQACRQTCYQRASEQGRNEVDAVSDCVRAHQCQDDACARAECHVEIAACEAPDVPEENGPEPVEPAPDRNDPADEDPNAGPVPEPGPQDEPDGNEGPEAPSPAPEDNDSPAVPEADEQPAPDAPDDAAQPEDDDEDDAPVDAQEDPQRPEADGTCDAPFNIGLGEAVGHTGEGQELNRGSCGGSGPEQVFQFAVREQTPICIDTLGSDVDTVLYVRTNGCAGQRNEIGCNDDFNGVQSQLSFMADPGTTYFVIVDSYNASGEFSLSVAPGNCL